MDATLADLGRMLEAQGMQPTFEGDLRQPIRGVATLEEAGPEHVSFLSNPKYEKMLQATRAGAVVLRPDVNAPPGFARIRVSDPYAAITVLIVRLHGYRQHRAPASATGASIHPTAEIGERSIVHPGATIDEQVVIGKSAVIYPGCYVGPRCRLGDNVTLYPNVVVYDDTILGSRVTIHANSVIGEDGLGYAPVNDQWVKIPQIGIVEVQDDVEIGAGCAIDRATLGRTVIGRGTKMSNLVAIGHGTHIGEHCMLVAQVGLAGSANVGHHVTMAGQCGVVGHIRIGDRATIAARAGVINSVPDGETVLGEPAIPIRDMKRQAVYMSRLPELYETMKRLERQISEIDKRVTPTEA